MMELTWKEEKQMRKTYSIVVTVVCVLSIGMLVFVGGYKTNFFKRQFVKLGLVKLEAKDRGDYYCISGWNNTLKKLNVDVDVVFYGNSITAGSSFDKYFPDLKICNLGYGGDDLDGLRFRAYTIAAVKPEKVFVMGGINGLNIMPLKLYPEKYELMIQSIKEAVPEAKIYLQSILPVKNHKMTNKIIECNKIIDSLSNVYGCQYIDLFYLYEKDGTMNMDYSEDGTHLKPEHYDKWAETIREYVYE